MPEPSADFWMRCSACRKDIPYEGIHWICSVSTCNRSRTRLVFCSVPCWDSHLSTLRHREAWAVEERAPSRAAWAAALREMVPDGAPGGVHAPAPSASAPARVTAGLPPARSAAPPAPMRSAAPPAPASAPAAPPPAARPQPSLPALSSTFDRDILVVVSKMKKYIKDRSGMNTGDTVAEVLSEHLRALCDDSIRAAAGDGRRTVLDRDVPRPRR